MGNRLENRILGALDGRRSCLFLMYPAVLNLAVENNITFYDACYITASETLRVPLITEDEKLKQIAAKYTKVLSWKEF
jgi:hypothetical protein